MQDMDATRSFGGTVKRSNLAHNGFHDLIAMLPTGSGTGASAFFASTPGNTFDKNIKLDHQDYFDDQTVKQHRPSNHCGSAVVALATIGGPPGTLDASNARSRVGDIHMPVERSSRPLPPIANAQSPSQQPSPITRLQESLLAVPIAAQATSPSAKPTLRRVPVPGVSPSQPMLKAQRLSASPPVSSAVVASTSHSPIRDGLHVTQHLTASLANRLGVKATPITTAPKTVSERVPLSSKQASGVRSGRKDGKTGKIDKRTISWPMEFR